MPIDRHGITIVAACLLTGCVPGRIEWSDGADVLRSALWVDQAPMAITDTPTRMVFLSNGVFDCDLPGHGDAAEQALAYEQLAVSITREEAHHVLLILGDPGPDATWEGDWTTEDTEERWASAAYARVEEVRRAGGRALSPTYEVTAAQCIVDEDRESFVEVIHHDESRLRGRFDLHVAGVQGRFDARRCQVEDDLVQVLLPWGLAGFCPQVVEP